MENFFHAFHFNVINSLINHQSLVLINIQFLNPTRSPIQLCSDGKFVIKKVKTNFHYHSNSFNDFCVFFSLYLYYLHQNYFSLIDVDQAQFGSINHSSFYNDEVLGKFVINRLNQASINAFQIKINVGPQRHVNLVGSLTFTCVRTP